MGKQEDEVLPDIPEGEVLTLIELDPEQKFTKPVGRFTEASLVKELEKRGFEEIINSPANNVAELLQQVAGIDIRRRGASGMQADLYIRGGGFDQTLLLIDGIKVEDPQTGHHLE